MAHAKKTWIIILIEKKKTGIYKKKIVKWEGRYFEH